VAPFAHVIAGIGGVLDQLLDAYRNGGGVPYRHYGKAFRHGQGHINRPAFVHELPTEWLDAMPDIRGRLRERGGRVADVGCGQGFSTIAIARAFPVRSVTLETFWLVRLSPRACRRRVWLPGFGWYLQPGLLSS
jgi:hypothetical protein